jgi:stage II sporulation protein D
VKCARSAVLLVLGLGACRFGEPGPGPAPAPDVAPPLAPGATLPGGEPVVRVGIVVDSEAALVGADVDFELRVPGGGRLATGRAGEVWNVAAAGEGLRARAPSGGSVDVPDGLLRVLPLGHGPVRIGDRGYRGEVLVQARAGGRVTAVNVVALEAYLLGVVPREIGRRPAAEIEAVKAQAVAARTYAIGNMGGRAALGFDFHATVMDQVYGGVADEDSITSRAVRETRGQILMHDGRPILAYYSSTCGGRTTSIEDAWPWRAPLPYLRSVPDLVPGTDSAYCATSSRFAWSSRWTRDELIRVLGETLRQHTRGAVTGVRRVTAVARADTTPSGTASLRLTADGLEHVLRADSLRWVLRPGPGPAILNSARLRGLDVRTAGGEVAELEIRGAGWGHGVGMCQVGAIGRARAGQTYDRILTAYYTDTELRTLY